MAAQSMAESLSSVTGLKKIYIYIYPINICKFMKIGKFKK